jgi:transposase InsO family protein
MRKKAVSPAHRRVVAQELVKNKACSQRAACRILRLARSTFRYWGRTPTLKEEQLRKRLLKLSKKHPRYGYRRIAALLRREGWRVGKRHIQRLRRDEGLRVPPTKRKVVRRGVSTGLPTTATHRNHVWTWDFIADATVRGGTLKMLTILDEYTRECHVLWAERAMKAADVLHWLQKAVEQHGAPEYALAAS